MKRKNYSKTKELRKETKPKQNFSISTGNLFEGIKSDQQLQQGKVLSVWGKAREGIVQM